MNKKLKHTPINPENRLLTDEQKLRLAMRALELAIWRLEEIQYQKNSSLHVEFLKDVLKNIKEN